jgi:hypothetical protein
MKSLIVILSVVFSTLALADFNGSWSGNGKVTYSSGTAANCPSMEMQFSQSATSFASTGAHIDCGQMTETMNSFTVGVVGQDMVVGGKKIGTLTDHSLVFEVIDAKSGDKESIHMDITAQGLSFLQQVTLANGTKGFTVEGLLTPR